VVRHRRINKKQIQCNRTEHVQGGRTYLALEIVLDSKLEWHSLVRGSAKTHLGASDMVVTIIVDETFDLRSRLVHVGDRKWKDIHIIPTFARRANTLESLIFWTWQSFVGASFEDFL